MPVPTWKPEILTIPELLSMCFEHFVFADCATNVTYGRSHFRPLTVDLAYALAEMDDECIDRDTVEMVIGWDVKRRKIKVEVFDQDEDKEVDTDAP